MSTLQFQTTVPESGTITLPPEFRGKIVRLDVSTTDTTEKSEEHSLLDFVKKYAGCLKDCRIESTDAMKEDRINYIIEKYK